MHPVKLVPIQEKEGQVGQAHQPRRDRPVSWLSRAFMPASGRAPLASQPSHPTSSAAVVHLVAAHDT